MLLSHVIEFGHPKKVMYTYCHGLQMEKKLGIEIAYDKKKMNLILLPL